jgi:regulator of protease activity HflC (stomatin/prohibitin superfamily)
MVESRKPRRPTLIESGKDTGTTLSKLAPRRLRPAAAIAIGLVAAFGLLFTLTGVFSGFDKTSGGEVGVVRNGGWFSDNRIRQVIPPGSGLTWIGLFSTVHRYPAQQRFYTITADSQRGDRPGVDVVHTPSSDGVEMGIEATIYFTVNISPDAIMSFDDKFGTRPFLGADGQLRYAWDGVDGWNGFFDAVVRPIIENDLRIQINNFHCAELVSSCALVQNGSLAANKTAPATPVANTTGQQNNSNIARVQQAINDSLPTDLRTNLGGDYFQNIRFNLVRVTLPTQIQDAVNKAQAAFAAVTEAQARVLQAQADADANKKRQEGYNACPTCAQIDMIKALPPGITTYAPGAGSAVPVK